MWVAGQSMAQFGPPSIPPLARHYLEPAVEQKMAQGSELLKSSGRLFLNVASALLRNKTLTATAAAAMATALSLYYLYTHPDMAAELAVVAIPAIGVGAALLTEKLLPAQKQSSLYPSAASRRPQPQIPSKKPVTPAQPLPQETAKAFEQAWKEGLQKTTTETTKRKQEQKEKEEEQKVLAAVKTLADLEKNYNVVWNEVQKYRTTQQPIPDTIRKKLEQTKQELDRTRNEIRSLPESARKKFEQVWRETRSRL